MHVILVSLIVFCLTLLIVTPVVDIYFVSQHEAIKGWAAMTSRTEQQAGASLQVSSVQGQQDDVHLVLRNTGSTKHVDFDSWDVIISYYDPTGNYVLCWIPPERLAQGGRWWSVRGLYLDEAQSIEETFDRGVLNPGEELAIDVKLAQPIMSGTMASVTASTAEGVQVWTAFEAQ
jgi:hypothetical protein